ncbi:MAG: 16S rRNA (guanine(527)-N(7))-methyltransferase RsmG, partial [Phaeodactylibacter sp.]|nr:16S rRNA (guanine(527)-N(7))-methyltransferase RsmG [Phaeodactylibacter sp.]
MEIIHKYFTDFTDTQVQQLSQLQALYAEWNAKINVISRKDIENLYERHVLHSLILSNVIHFKKGAKILDLGTGGGFPGIPLAILFPDAQFTLIHGTGKKIQVVKEVVAALGLKNVTARQQRAEELKGERFDFVISRAVAKLAQLMIWARPLLSRKHKHSIPNGLIVLKGGSIREEIREMPKG